MCVASSLIFDVDLPASTLLESMWVLQAFNVKVMKVLRCKYDMTVVVLIELTLWF